MTQAELTPEVERQLKSWPYQNERVIMAPYLSRLGTQNFPEGFLVSLYARIKEEKLLELVFPGVLDSSLPAVVGYLHKQILWVGMLKPSFEVAGIGWLYNIEGRQGARKAMFGFCFFRKYWGQTEIRELADMALRTWFEESDIDVLLGTTLKENAMAQYFAKQLGFQVVAEVPQFFPADGKLNDAVFVMLTKKDYQMQRAVLTVAEGATK